jgi:chromosome segregation ATPase
MIMRVKLVLSVLLALSCGVIGWLSVRSSHRDAQIRALEQQVRTALTRVPPPVVPPPAAAPASAAAKPVEAPPRERHAASEPAVDPEVETLRGRVQDSAASTAKLQARVSELETEVLNVMGERARAASAEVEARARVAELTRTVESMNAERPAAEKRMRDLETEIGRLREQNAAAAQKDTQIGQLSAELRDITRRQQTTAANILRRYREVTDIFRSLPGMLESKGNGPEVARIQTAISMADEDVRQLNDLNARLGRLEKRITAAAERH